VFTLWNLDAVEDLSPLTQLPRLECLYLAWHATRHLPIARELPTLRRLYLYSDHVTDLTPLQGVVHLTVHVGRRQKILHAELLGEGSKIVRD